MNELDQISGANIQPSLDVENIESEHQTLISLLIDESGSMGGYTDTMRDCIQHFKEALKNSKSADEVLVSVTRFNSSIKSSGFQLVDDIKDDYDPDGMTRLYDSVLVGQKMIYTGNGDGYAEQLKQNGIRTKSILCIFSDGEDTDSNANIRDAANAIELLNKQEIITAFVAFGPSAHGIADQLGVTKPNQMDVSASESELRKVFNVLSKSAISASNSVTPQSDFFVS
jgi:uncharacterized protein YegL